MLRGFVAGALWSLSLFAVAGADAPLLEWTELMPPNWVPSAPQYEEFFDAVDGPPPQELDAPVVEALDGRRIALEGWLVPLELERAERYHEFLLVPFLGACVHVPPPPANQVVHLRIEEGVRHQELMDPQRVTGRLRASSAQTDLATAAYRMEEADAEMAQW